MLHSINRPITGHISSSNQPIRSWFASFISNHFLPFSVQLLLKQMRNLINVKKMEINVKSGRNKSLSKTSLHWRKKQSYSPIHVHQPVSVSIQRRKLCKYHNQSGGLYVRLIWFYMLYTRGSLSPTRKSRWFCIYIFHEQVISIQIWAFLFLYVLFFLSHFFLIPVE